MKYRRLRGDMIETYKILTGRYDNQAAPALLSAEGITLKLIVNRIKYTI